MSENRNPQVCVNCIMDTTDETIIFDEKGYAIIVEIIIIIFYQTGILMNKGNRKSKR